MFTSCYLIRLFPSRTVSVCASFVLAVSLTVDNGLNHSRSARGGAIHVGTNGLGHSWPNIVVVAGKATGRRDEERGEEREKVRERERGEEG